jgi:hypothetical protein
VVGEVIAAAAVDPQTVIDVGLAPFTVLGAGVSFWSGLLGFLSMLTGGDKAAVSAAVDRGVALGFLFAGPFAVYTFGVALTSI